MMKIKKCLLLGVSVSCFLVFFASETVVQAANGFSMSVGKGAASGAMGAAFNGASLGQIAGQGLMGAGMGAISALCPWCGIGLSAAGGVLTFLNMGQVAYQVGSNIDAAQIAAEAWVYSEMQEVTYEWEPEPAESYEKTAEENENNAGCSMNSVTEAGALNFEVQSLTATGIEAVGLEPTPQAMVGGRPVVMDKMTFLTAGQGGVDFKVGLPTEAENKIIGTQTNHEQFLGSAGVARAELALATAKQAAVDGGAASTDNSDNQTPGEKPDGFAGATGDGAKLQSLAGLIGSGTSTAAAMRVQTLMNLELAQRLNLTDMLQGSSLSLQAARLLRESNPL